MHGPALTGIPQEALEALHSVLKNHFELSDDSLPSLHKVESASANDASHLLAIYPSGRQIGLKAADRIVQGTAKEDVVSSVMKELEIPGHSPSMLCSGVPQLGSIADRAFVATEWNRGLNLGHATQDDCTSIAQSPEGFLEAYGEWVVGCLVCDVGDDKSKHWIWDEASGTLTHVDHEESFNGGGTPKNYIAPLATTGFYSKVKTVGSPERAALVRGIERAAKRAEDKKQQLKTIVEGAGLKLSDWINKGPNQFSSDFVSGL